MVASQGVSTWDFLLSLSLSKMAIKLAAQLKEVLHQVCTKKLPPQGNILTKVRVLEAEGGCRPALITADTATAREKTIGSLQK